VSFKIVPAVKDCFIEDRIVIEQGLNPNKISRNIYAYDDKITKGYLTYITENNFILLQICADYCEKYDGIFFNKYKLKINLSYGLRENIKKILDNYDFLIKSDGDLGPEYFINNPSITIEGANKINKNNIQIQVLLLNESEKPKEEPFDKLFDSIYNIHKDKQIDINYFQKYLSGYKIDNIKTIFDQYNTFSINKNKKIISNLDELNDYVFINKFFIDNRTKEEVLGYIHCKYNIQFITDEQIYNLYELQYLKKYLKYKKKYLFLKYNI